MPQKVIIIGGGVAGLTAAHYLSRKNFDVSVYERRSYFGGKAASVRLPRVAPDSVGCPGEHGFRFFPQWYRHVVDTMEDIPFRGRGNVGPERSVAEHLVPCDENEIRRYRGPATPIALRLPRTSNQAQALVSFFLQLNQRIPPSEIASFFQELAKFVSYPESERRRIYDEISWWKLVDAEQKTAEFRELIVATTQSLLAAQPKQSSAYTIANLAVRTLFARPLDRDRVLDGPTNEVWIKPWVTYLQGRGVRFVPGRQLDSVVFDEDEPKIRKLRFSAVADNVGFKYARQADRARRAGEQAPHWGNNAVALAQELGGNARFLDGQYLDSYVAPVPIEDDADYYVFALPVEQMAYFVNRSATMTSYDESLRNITTLAGSTEWMAGIQFYLTRALPSFPKGHVVCSDTEWALTVREQTHLWRDTALPADVRALLTVDISNWRQPGRSIPREAATCTRDEVAREVWEQLKESFNRDNDEMLRDDMLLGGGPGSPRSFYLDDNIVEISDRRKQAAYSRANSLRGSSEELLAQAAREQDASFAFGDRASFNLEPLLVNRPGALARRPSAATRINNMFLAADYVDTRANLASMEGANEAGRLAVNAILAKAQRTADPCEIFSYEDGEALATLTGWAGALEANPLARSSVEFARNAADLLGSAAGRFSDVMRNLGRRK
jgi:uncharacterized protein with NAD-binding domain and iron-sulfur cluster